MFGSVRWSGGLGSLQTHSTIENLFETANKLLRKVG